MIRILALDENMDERLLNATALEIDRIYGIGCVSEFAEELFSKEAIREAGVDACAIDAENFLTSASRGRHRSNDILIFLTRCPLAPRQVLGQTLPTISLAMESHDIGIVSLSFLRQLPQTISEHVRIQSIAKLACHEVGHISGLRHCTDAACLMYPPWTPDFFAPNPKKRGELSLRLCDFCRGSSQITGQDGQNSDADLPAAGGSDASLPLDEIQFRNS